MSAAGRDLVRQDEEFAYEAPRAPGPVIAMTPEQLQALIVGIKQNDARPAGAPAITLADLFEQYSIVRGPASNWDKIRLSLAPLIRRLADLPSSDLTPLEWARHRSARAQEPNRRGTMPKPITLVRELMRAKEMLKWAVANKLLDANPLAEAKPERTICARETWLTDEDLERLLDAIGRVRDRRGPCIPGYREYRPIVLRAFVLCCVDSGLRMNEARTLQRDRIGSNGVVELLARETKSRRRRIVALTPRTLEAIAAIPEEWSFVPTSCKNPIVIRRSTREPYIFISPRTGELLPGRTLLYWFRQAVELAGLDERCAAGDVRLRIHDLRHTFASLADAKGASSTAIRDALGHTNLNVTQRYLHRDQEAGAVALAQLMDAASPMISIGELYKRYAKRRQYEPAWRLIRNRLDPLVQAMADLPAIELTPAVWSEHAMSRAAEPASDATLNTELQRAKEMFRWAVDQRLLERNPLQSAPPHVRRNGHIRVEKQTRHIDPKGGR